MDFDELFGPNRVLDYPDVAMLGDEVASKLNEESSDIVRVYTLDDMDVGEIMERLKKAGYEELPEQGENILLIVDENSLKIMKSAYIR